MFVDPDRNSWTVAELGRRLQHPLLARSGQGHRRGHHERQQADGGDGLGSAGFVRVERASGLASEGLLHETMATAPKETPYSVSIEKCPGKLTMRASAPLQFWQDYIHFIFI